MRLPKLSNPCCAIPNWTRYQLPATSLRLPRSTACHGDHLRGRSSWGKTLTEPHKNTERSSRPERRRPRRHQQLSTMTLRKLRETREKIHPLRLPRGILQQPPAHVPHGCRIQTHRSRSRYRHGFERALDHSFGVV
jgi:hypothetical protein